MGSRERVVGKSLLHLDALLMMLLESLLLLLDSVLVEHRRPLVIVLLLLLLLLRLLILRITRHLHELLHLVLCHRSSFGNCVIEHHL